MTVGLWGGGSVQGLLQLGVKQPLRALFSAGYAHTELLQPGTHGPSSKAPACLSGCVLAFCRCEWQAGQLMGRTAMFRCVAVSLGELSCTMCGELRSMLYGSARVCIRLGQYPQHEVLESGFSVRPPLWLLLLPTSTWWQVFVGC